MPQTVRVNAAEPHPGKAGDIVDYDNRISGPYMVCETTGREVQRYWLDLQTGKLHAAMLVSGIQNRILPPGTRLVIEV